MTKLTPVLSAHWDEKDSFTIEAYTRHGGYTASKKALAMDPDAVIQLVKDSGLRGRGGAAFPTGIKWETVRKCAPGQKYIVCNADEGDSGTFSDRMVMEDDPFMLIEGMTIAGLAVGANKGYIYVRSEYPHAIAALNEAITVARKAQYLGANILGSGKAFDLEVRMGAGSYVCGEETALLESLEGKRGIVRAKPPLPAISGLFGKPTVINNVISLASVPIILARGAEFYRDYGIVNFPCGNTGTQMGGFFRKEIKSLADIKGLKFRIGGFGGVVLQRIGVIAQNIPGGEIYTALERGTIDAAEFIGPYDDEKLGLHKVARFYHYPSYWDGCGQITMYVGAKAWESLPKEYQAIFEVACAEAHVDMQAKYDARNPAALKRLVAGGVQLRPFPKAMADAAYSAAEELYAELSEKNPRWRKIHSSYARFCKDAIMWSRFSDGAFDSYMATTLNRKPSS